MKRTLQKHPFGQPLLRTLRRAFGAPSSAREILSGKKKGAQRLTFWVRRPPGGVGVFHVKGWWSKTSCSPSKLCLPWVSKRGIWDVPGILPGCPGPLGVFKKFVQKQVCAHFSSLYLGTFRLPFFYFFLLGEELGSPRHQEGGGGSFFYWNSHRRGGGRGRDRGAGRVSVANWGILLGGGALSIFIRGWNVHQEYTLWHKIIAY